LTLCHTYLQIRADFRLDAGFGTPENVAMLIEEVKDFPYPLDIALERFYW